ncbi:hypothetical protein J5N97_023945 [Dioscorea zingiberensis]|uniref:Uncharacterized protein n=1 Tax=Dioscorea zingiberensis TaxID=325984 RepID=A0A9D5C639_9LILI|nr:hypothetical protein J5N97_023945 [Dioscorea zingiberensis]
MAHEDHHHHHQVDSTPLLAPRDHEEEEDLEEIRSLKQLASKTLKEKKKLWYLAGPAIFTSLAQYSLGAVTQVFAGHLTTLELDAVSTENMVIAGLAFGVMDLAPENHSVCLSLSSSISRSGIDVGFNN